MALRRVKRRRQSAESLGQNGLGKQVQRRPLGTEDTISFTLNFKCTPKAQALESLTSSMALSGNATEK